jgi:hypothetical protein
VSKMKDFLENYNELARDYYRVKEEARVWELVAYMLHYDCYCEDAGEHLEAMYEEQRKRKL